MSKSAASSNGDRSAVVDHIRQDIVDTVDKQLHRLVEVMEATNATKAQRIGAGVGDVQCELASTRRLLMEEKKKVQLLEEEKRKWETGYLDTSGLSRDNVRASIDWEKSSVGNSKKDGADVNAVVDAVWVGLRRYSQKGSKDLDDDLVLTIRNELPKEFHSTSPFENGKWFVSVGFHHKLRMYAGDGTNGGHRTWYLNFEFVGKNFRIMCGFNKSA
jgi:hypothetical protein